VCNRGTGPLGIVVSNSVDGKGETIGNIPTQNNQEILKESHA